MRTSHRLAVVATLASLLALPACGDDSAVGGVSSASSTDNDAGDDGTAAPGSEAPAVQADPRCPAADGSSVVTQQFADAPPMCLTPGASYSAVIETNVGSLTIALDATRAPLTVNSFVYLARFGYFNNTQCHRALPGFVVQCGDPTATGTGGPGYRFADELPQAGEYQIGSVAMANAGPDTNGSQFFLITGPSGASLPPSYSLFGMITDGLDTTLAALDALSNPDPASNGVPPLQPITITSVTITES
jgi:cyclophilin family peptidyl-prolyl cis-trans isomerase